MREIEIGDLVTWRSAYGYRTGGKVLALDDDRRVATVNSVGHVRSKCVAVTRVAVETLELVPC